MSSKAPDDMAGSSPPDDVISKVRQGPQPGDYRPPTDAPIPMEIFEPIPEADAGPSRGSAAGMPPIAEPRPPASGLSQRKVSEARTPWKPPALSATLPRLTLPVILIAIPIAAAFVLQAYLSGTHGVYDDALKLADGGADEVTALEWSPLEGGPLLVGTRMGSVKHILSDGTVEEVLSPSSIDPADGEATSPVQSFHALSTQSPVVIYQNRLNPVTDRPADAFAVTQLSPGLFSVQGGLFAAVDANNGSAVVGRAVVPDSGQLFEQPTNNTFIGNPVQQQQQQIPTGEQLKGERPQQVPIDPGGLPSSPLRYSISLFRDLQTASTMVGDIFGIEDVRAVAALPGTSTVIAGDGSGNVFAIDASQQISGASPETYLRGIGQHETAIVEIAIAAQPADGTVLFATRAEDRTIKVWRGSVNRGSELIPLGDYPSTNVTTPGSTWVRERISFASRRSRTTDVNPTALLGMAADGRRILAKRANMELVLLDLPAQGEEGTATEYRDVYYVAADSPAALSPDGSRLLAPDITNNTIVLVELQDVPSGQASQYAVASFRGLAGSQFRRFAFDGTGQRFIAIATNGTVYIQNVATPEQAVTLGQYQGTGVDAAISPDGSLVAVAVVSETRIVIHSAEDGSELTTFDGPQYLGRLSFDASGKRLRAVVDDITGTWGATILTYSLRNSRRTTHLVGFTPDVAREGFLANGDRYFLRNGDAGYRIVDLDGNADVGALEAAVNATGWVSNLDGSRIATLGGGGNISLFHEQEAPTANGPMPAMADNAMRLSADGRTLIVGSRNGELHLARLDGGASQTGYRLRRLVLPVPALQYEIAPDGTSIVTAEADGTVAISDLTFEPPAPDVSAGQVQTTTAEPEATPAPAVTVAETIDLPGHGAPVTAIALSPDGQELATASLDGRLRVTSVAWARFVHELPLAELPSGPERPPLEAEPLDDSPYALMGEPQASGNGGARPFVVVYNARTSLGEARGVRDRAAAAGFPDGLIYRRQGFFRGVLAFATDEARDAALPGIQEVFPGAYARNLRTWCPDGQASDDFVECATVLTGAEPPPAMAN